MNNEVLKPTEQNPQGYGPKKPEIIDMAKKSKIFDLLPAGVPILFSGSGEGAATVAENGFGLVSKYGDYKALEENIRHFTEMSDAEYSSYSANCLNAAGSKFSFAMQMDKFCKFLREPGH